MADDGGLSKFQKRMRAIPKAVRLAVHPALVTGAEEIAAAIKSLAPKDTGALAESVAVTGPLQQTPPYSQPGGSMTAPETGALVTVGNTDVRYAHLVEYGTAGAAAQPFFWPGFRLTRKKAANRIKRAMSQAVKGPNK